MRLGITNRNVYTVILGMIFLASVLQLSFLGRGILSSINASEMNAVAPIEATATPIQSGQTPASNAAAFTPTHITIEKVGIDLNVVSVPLKNGTWQVYAGVANYAEGTSLVNENSGNVGIYAHDRQAEFAKIKQTLTGYDIMLNSDKYRAIYKVESASIIAPTAVNVFYPTDEPMLTLITCEGAFSEKRFMVRAKLVKLEKIK